MEKWNQWALSEDGSVLDVSHLGKDSGCLDTCNTVIGLTRRIGPI
jgi:hypothetical protein